MRAGNPPADPRFHVRLDLARVCARISAGVGRHVSVDELRARLVALKFKTAGTGDDEWIVDRHQLGNVQPDEVLSVEPVTAAGRPGEATT